ncbi:MAG: SH3 domain-containing protein [Lachnospiraceae bacterium]|nr:SH3 domain-containing protein [Lachnospiraceae bacterium]
MKRFTEQKRNRRIINRRMARKLRNSWVPAVAFIVVASTISGVAFANKEPVEDTEVDAEMISEEVRSVVLLGGAAQQTEVSVLSGISVAVTAEEILPVSGAADDLLFKEDQVLHVMDDKVVQGHETVEAAEAVAEDGIVEEAAPEEAAPEEESVSENEVVNEYENFALADVHMTYINVRSGPGTDYSVVGKMYDGSVAEILDETEEADGLWFHMVSGNVEGYIKAEYFFYGDNLADVIADHILQYAVVQVNCLNVRKEASVDSDRIGYMTAEEKVLILEEEGDWYKVQYTDDKVGYIASEYVAIQEEYITAKSLEEERAEEQAKKEKEERERQKQKEVKEDVTIAVSAPATNYSTNPELRQAMVNYALQYVGNRYVPAGGSLSGGTDCSGFTCYVYRDFGYSIARTPSGQMGGAGRSISLAEAQPGDIICYGYGGCSHVAMYIGNGQIVHEANSRLGCVISGIDFMPIVGVKSVID